MEYLSGLHGSSEAAGTRERGSSELTQEFESLLSRFGLNGVWADKIFEAAVEARCHLSSSIMHVNVQPRGPCFRQATSDVTSDMEKTGKPPGNADGEGLEKHVTIMCGALRNMEGHIPPDQGNSG
jgi:hypothetical protein